MSNGSLILGSCAGRLCDYTIDYVNDRASCSGGGGSCSTAKMVTTSLLPNTHNGHLKGAGTAIQAILNGLANHTPPGKELAVFNMKTGIMLAWIDHQVITPLSDSADVMTALQLEDVTVEEPAQLGD
jgi:hypothetical protein